MKKIILILGMAVTLAATSLSAADAKNYQVTGPVLEINDSYIVVQKGEDKWQMACDKVTAGKIKVGDKVTVQYQMVAKSVEVKPAKADKADRPEKKK
jgi:uncharacterized protein YdbL (DUF1318 family)